MKNNTNHSVFVFYNKATFILIYIDNLLIISEDLNIINAFKNKLFKYFYIINLGSISFYLGMSVIQTSKSMS